jgi:hypothetical protein
MRPLEDFHRDKNRPSGRTSWCRECKARLCYPNRRGIILKHLYGITLRDYDEMFHKQASGCAVCGEWPGEKPLCVDHCHDTGEVRGLLCNNCNTGIGMLRDDPMLVLRAYEYLEKD